MEVTVQFLVFALLFETICLMFFIYREVRATRQAQRLVKLFQNFDQMLDRDFTKDELSSAIREIDIAIQDYAYMRDADDLIAFIDDWKRTREALVGPELPC